MVTELPLDIYGVANTPVAINLFNANPDARKLSEEIAQLFHHLVAKLIYLCRRTWPDVQTEVAFLCARVRKPDEDHYFFNKPLQAALFMRMQTKILNLPSGTSIAMQRSVFEWKLWGKK